MSRSRDQTRTVGVVFQSPALRGVYPARIRFYHSALKLSKSAGVSWRVIPERIVI